MTSGNFHSILIMSITVLREERHRREIKEKDIDNLMDSIKRLGLINPICVTRELILVAGECRLRACKKLGWSHISVQYVDELPQDELECIELEENIKRADISWPDRCRAVQRIHALSLKTDSTWTEVRTGEKIGLSQQMVGQYLNLAKEIDSGNPAIKALAADKSSKVSQALTTMYRQKERKAAAQMDLFNEAVFDKPQGDSITCVDFNVWAPSYEGPLFNFLHCDFPYGINAQNFNQSSGPVHGDYDDREETYWRLLHTLADNVDKLLSPSAHIIFWFSPRHYCETRNFFQEHTDIIIDKYPLVWHKSDGSGIIPDPLRGPRRTYEMAFFGVRGDRTIVRPVTNSYGAPISHEDHMSVKPEPMLRHFLEMVVDETTLMLDPTCGSGSSIRAAESLGAKTTLGLEINSEFAERARLALLKARRLRSAA